MIGRRLHPGDKPRPGLVLLWKRRFRILAARILQRRRAWRTCGCGSAGDLRGGGRAYGVDHQRRLPEDDELLLIPELLPELLVTPEDEP